MVKSSLKFLVIFLLLAVAPFMLSLFHLNILMEILILGIFALSLNVLVGYTGLVSLGHAAFFGVGAYASGIVAKEVSSNLFITLPASLIAAMIVSAIIGIFCMKVSGFYFLMLTLAFSQMIYSFIHQSTDLTGGSNGLSGIPAPLIGGINFSSPVFLFYLILVVFAAVFGVLSLLVRSPFGQVLIGIRENETRIKSMGYNTTTYKYVAFIIAGGLGGIAGSLYTNFNGFIGPSDVYWTMSGSVLMMVLVGGVGTMVGPVLGAALIVILETVVSSYTEMTMLIIGIIFILFVIFLPKGLAGVGNSVLNNFIKNKSAYNEKNPKAVYKKDA